MYLDTNEYIHADFSTQQIKFIFEVHLQNICLAISLKYKLIFFQFGFRVGYRLKSAGIESG